MHVAHYQRNCLFRFSIRHRLKSKSINAKFSPPGRKVSRRQLFCRCTHILIIEGASEVVSGWWQEASAIIGRGVLATDN
jgi:hypothetical protein